jgi:hypothetical protein
MLSSARAAAGRDPVAGAAASTEAVPKTITPRKKEYKIFIKPTELPLARYFEFYSSRPLGGRGSRASGRTVF